MKRSLSMIVLSFAVLAATVGGASAIAGKPGSYDWAGASSVTVLR